MRNYILADNQELTRFALESLLHQDKEATVYRASDKASLVTLLKEHEAAVVLLDYTLFDFSDEDQLLIVAERFSLSDWILISDELTPQFLRVWSTRPTSSASSSRTVHCRKSAKP